MISSETKNPSPFTTVIGNAPLSEQQPSNFKCEVTYKPRGIFLYKIKVLIEIVDTLKALAMRSFEQHEYDFQVTSEGIRVRFRSSATHPVGYQVKSIMWTLRWIAWHFHNTGHTEPNPYREVTFKTRYGDEQFLGFGHLLSAPSPSSSAPNSSSLSESKITITNFICLDLGLEYEPADIYAALINMMIGAAETFPERGGGSHYFAVYNSNADATLLLASTSERAAPLQYDVVITLLGELGYRMANFERQYRWRQFTFLIRDDGRIIGRGAWTKGRVTAAEGFFGKDMEQLDKSPTVLLEAS